MRFRVLIDGLPPGDFHGLDVNSEGYGTVAEQRLYQLIKALGPVKDRQLEIEFFDRDVETVCVHLWLMLREMHATKDRSRIGCMSGALQSRSPAARTLNLWRGNRCHRRPSFNYFTAC